jgi:Glucose / Sorbosone dehydrogenase
VPIHNPRTGLNTLAAEVPIYQHDEEGLQGIAIDPDFSRNHWVYLYYSPPLDTPVDDPSTPEVNEGDAPFEGTEADFARFRACSGCRASSWSATSSTSAPSSRSSTWPPTAASAAT